LGVTL